MSQLPDTAVCLHCGYSLRRLPNNLCPECGHPFDPADTATWQDLGQPSILIRIAHSERGPRAPRRWELQIVLVLTLFLLFSLSLSWATVSGHLYLCVFLLVCAFALQFAVGAVLSIIRLIHANMNCPLAMCPLRQTAMRPRTGRRWTILIGCFAVLLVLWGEPRALNYGRLWLSRSAFHRKAMALSPAVEGRQWVGLVQVDLIRRPNPDEVVFEIDWARWEGTVNASYDRRSGRPDPVLGIGWNSGWRRFSFPIGP